MGSVSVEELTRRVATRSGGPEVEVVGRLGVSLAVRPGLLSVATSSVPLRVSLVHRNCRREHMVCPIAWSSSSVGAWKDRPGAL